MRKKINVRAKCCGALQVTLTPPALQGKYVLMALQGLKNSQTTYSFTPIIS